MRSPYRLVRSWVSIPRLSFMRSTVRVPTVAPQRPQGGTFMSPRRGMRILPGGDSEGPFARYRPTTMTRVGRSQPPIAPLIAAAVFVFALGILSRGNIDSGSRDLDALGVVLAALASLPLGAPRLAPLAVLAVVTGATAALYGFGYGLGPPIGFAVALYSVAESRDETRSRTWIAAAVLSLAVLLGPHVITGQFGPELLLGTAVWAAAWLAGDRARLRRERLPALGEHERPAPPRAPRRHRALGGAVVRRSPRAPPGRAARRARGARAPGRARSRARAA